MASMYDVLSEAMVDHVKSMYNLSEPVHCNVMIGKCRPADSDVCLIPGQSVHLSSDVSGAHCRSSVTNTNYSLLFFDQNFTCFVSYFIQ